MSQDITFANLGTADGGSVELVLRGFSGREIDDTDRAGQVTLYIANPENDAEEPIVIDLELPVARTLASALIMLCNWADRTDDANQRKHNGRR